MTPLRNAFENLATEAKQDTLIAQGASKRLELDYVGRTDTQPIYLGKAPPATATSATTWTVMKFAYESGSVDARMTRFDVRENLSWDNRADPTLNGQPAWDF